MNNGILSEVPPPNSEADGKMNKGSTFCEFMNGYVACREMTGE